jgi:hypothetical protein
MYPKVQIIDKKMIKYGLPAVAKRCCFMSVEYSQQSFDFAVRTWKNENLINYLFNLNHFFSQNK